MFFDVRLTKALKRRQKKEAEAEIAPPEQSFVVHSVRRITKIYDEDDSALLGNVGPSSFPSYSPPVSNEPSPLPTKPRARRSSSVASTHSLPRGARPYRTSWAIQDFAEWDAVSAQRPERGLAKRLSSYSLQVLPYRNTLDSFSEDDERMCVGHDAKAMISGASATPPRRDSTRASSKSSSDSEPRPPAKIGSVADSPVTDDGSEVWADAREVVSPTGR